MRNSCGLLLSMVLALPCASAYAQKVPFAQRFIFTGGTSVVLPLGDFKTNLSPAFSAATGADFVASKRLLIGLTFSYNRHGYESSTLYPGIRLDSNTELINFFLNGRLLLTDPAKRVTPYLLAGPGFSSISRPAIRPADGAGEIRVTSRSSTVAMANVGGGLDIKLNPKLTLYLESAYNTSLRNNHVQFVPVLLGVRTFPVDFFRK